MLTREILDNQLLQYRNNCPSDITDKLFLIIQNDSQLHREYQNAARGNTHAVNSRIGREIREYWSLQNTGTCHNPLSALVNSYTMHSN